MHSNTAYSSTQVKHAAYWISDQLFYLFCSCTKDTSQAVLCSSEDLSFRNWHTICCCAINSLVSRRMGGSPDYNRRNRKSSRTNSTSFTSQASENPAFETFPGLCSAPDEKFLSSDRYEVIANRCKKSCSKRALFRFAHLFFPHNRRA
jgi:hypothetical protein